MSLWLLRSQESRVPWGNQSVSPRRGAAQGSAPRPGGRAGSTRVSGLGGPGLGRALYLVESQCPIGRNKKPSLTGGSEDSLRVRMKAVRCPPGACREGTDTGLARPLLWGFHCPRRYKVLGGGDLLRSPGRTHVHTCAHTQPHEPSSSPQMPTELPLRAVSSEIILEGSREECSRQIIL